MTKIWGKVHDPYREIQKGPLDKRQNAIQTIATYGEIRVARTTLVEILFQIFLQ